MINIDSKKCIFLTRGDNASINVKLASGSFQSGDIVKFSVGNAGLNIVLQKSVTSFNADGSADIDLVHNDTKDLKYGTYQYDVQLDRSGVIQTVIAAQLPDGTLRTFTLGMEVGT